MKNVKKLIAEISLYNDEIIELEQQNLLQQSDKKFFCELVEEYRKKSKEKRGILTAYKNELQEIIENQELLDGRISKTVAERKEKLEKEIEVLTKEVEIDKKNQEDAFSSVKEISESRLSLENKQKIKEYQEKIQANKKELQIIYDDCKEKITSISSKIEEKENSYINVSDKDEKRKIIKELNDLYAKEEKYFTVYKDIIKLIDEKQVLDVKEDVKEVEETVELTQEQKEKLEKEEIERKMAEAARVVAEREEKKKSQNNPEKAENDKENIEDLEENIIKETEKVIQENEKTDEQKQAERQKMEEAAKKVAEKYKDEPRPESKKDDGRIFTDEERIDENHRWMNASNAFNTGYVDVQQQVEQEKTEEQEIEQEVEMEEEKQVVNETAEKEKVSFGKCVIGKIKNISKLPQHLKEVLANKFKLGNVKVSAGTEESLENQQGLARG